MKIGVGISTTNNRDVLSKSLEYFDRYTPFEVTIFNDTKYRGVARTKNNLLAILENCDHVFLFDDDCYPIAENWWLPYINSGENHLMYQFKLPNKPATDMQEIYRNDKIAAYTHTRGAMLYVTKKVLETVGGLDNRYGLAMYEHTDWTNRIFNAGLTSFRAMDVVGSDKLLYCMDQDGSIESSIDPKIRRHNLIKNKNFYNESKHSVEFKEYR